MAELVALGSDRGNLRVELYDKLEAALRRIRYRDSADLFGEVDFEVVDRLSGRRSVIARYRANKILVKASAAALPSPALEYLVAHELAHIVTRKHTRTFRNVLETLYPNFEAGKLALQEFKAKLQ